LPADIVHGLETSRLSRTRTDGRLGRAPEICPDSPILTCSNCTETCLTAHIHGNCPAKWATRNEGVPVSIPGVGSSRKALVISRSQHSRDASSRMPRDRRLDIRARHPGRCTGPVTASVARGGFRAGHGGHAENDATSASAGRKTHDVVRRVHGRPGAWAWQDVLDGVGWWIACSGWEPSAGSSRPCREL